MSDLISKDYVMKVLAEECKYYQKGDRLRYGLEIAIMLINSRVPCQKPGHWNVWYHGASALGKAAFSYSCSECGSHQGGETNFCSNCGAKMVGEEV